MVWYRYHRIAQEMGVPGHDLFGIYKVFIHASIEYDNKIHSYGNFSKTDVMKFKIKNYYIEQCEFFTALGITVTPREWMERISCCEEVTPFGPLFDFNSCEKRRETLVEFPCSLFSVCTEDDVMEKLNSLSSPKKKVELKNRKITFGLFLLYMFV